MVKCSRQACESNHPTPEISSLPGQVSLATPIGPPMTIFSPVISQTSSRLAAFNSSFNAERRASSASGTPSTNDGFVYRALERGLPQSPICGWRSAGAGAERLSAWSTELSYPLDSQDSVTEGCTTRTGPIVLHGFEIRSAY